MSKLPFPFDPTADVYWVPSELLECVRAQQEERDKRMRIFDDGQVVDLAAYRNDRRLRADLKRLTA
ncbi:hypothetical protein ACK6D9_12175 [Hoeflea sp. Naph1]|uniref:hypothetical protein n=1 Tax=Hoeflea sp. Naph1 TaxID=3388653 RepID=UPI0039900589